MQTGEHGFDYDRLRGEYGLRRRSDPRIERELHAALGSAHSVLNAGAGTGSYEPRDRNVLALEPSRQQRAQRPPDAAPALSCGVDELPFDDDSFDASMALFSVHHWPDPARGLRELRRVTRGPVLVLTFDPEAETQFWMGAFAPAMAEVDRRRYGPLERVCEALGGQPEVRPVLVPRDCRDSFQAALYARPEEFLSAETRAAQSAWAHLPEGEEQRIVSQLEEELASGEWDERFGWLRSQPQIRCQLRLVVSPS